MFVLRNLSLSQVLFWLIIFGNHVFTNSECFVPLQILEADADNSGQTHSQDFLQPFIVAKMAVLPEIFMLADEKKYNGYYNRPLPILQQFRCFVLADLKDLESVSIPCVF